MRNAAGDVTCSADDNGDYEVTTWDWRGRPSTRTDSTSCTATGSADVTWRYDGAAMPEAPRGRLRPETAQGQLTGVLDAAGGEELSYDELGRVIASRRWWTGTHEARLGYVYDDEGNLVEESLGGGSRSAPRTARAGGWRP